jgi:hypothetical protein
MIWNFYFWNLAMRAIFPQKSFECVEMIFSGWESAKIRPERKHFSQPNQRINKMSLHLCPPTIPHPPPHHPQRDVKKGRCYPAWLHFHWFDLWVSGVGATLLPCVNRILLIAMDFPLVSTKKKKVKERKKGRFYIPLAPNTSAPCNFIELAC